MTIESLLITILLVSGFLVGYHHILFPVWLNIYRRRHPLPLAPDPLRHFVPEREDIKRPRITLIIPAHNEASVITQKINNLGALDYPSKRLEVILVCDGCNDNTAELARAQHQQPENNHLNLKIIEHTDNRGKIVVLNSTIDQITSDIVALSDASALISADALLIAVRHFNNSEIAVVAGQYQLLNPGSEGEATYWRYQSAIKQGEAAMGSPMGAHGAFYLFRRALFSALPMDTINDDFILPMSLVAQGFKAIYEPKIVALELEQANTQQDATRRQRIAAGNLQQLIRLRSLMHPRFAGIALIFTSGKALRAFMPWCLLLMLISSILLWNSHPLFMSLALAQVVGYLLALCAHRFPRLQRFSKIQTLHYLVCGHVSGLLGSIRYLMGHSQKLWEESKLAKENSL